MHPLHSNAEWRIYDALKRAGLHSLMMDKTVVLKTTLDGDEVEFPTYPDYYYRNLAKRELWLFYLDGPPHLKRTVEQRDTVVNSALEKAGIKYKRYGYKAPLTDKRFREIVANILENVRNHA